ncbi:MAG: ABC transporter substrate-binding protein [Ignisphaera sp.]
MTRSPARIIAILAVVFVACSLIYIGLSREGVFRGSNGSRYVRELKIAISTDITTIDINYATSVADFEILGKVYESLFRIDYDPVERKLVYIPQLVEKYTHINETFWFFVLRDGVKFHNGKELTAWDVEASIKRSMEISPIGRMLLRDAEGVPIIDDIIVYNSSSFALRLRKPFAPLIEHLAHLSVAVIPKDVAEKYMNRKIESLDDVIGTGPYRLIEYVRGQYVKLQRFDDHWGKKPSLEIVIYRIVPDVNSRITALKTGEVDISVGIPPEIALQLKKEGFKVYNETGVRFVIAAINTLRIPDVRIRRAMNYAVDRRSIVENIAKGFAVVAKSIVSPIFPNVVYLEPYSYDPEEAKRLISEAGGINRTLILLVSTRSPKDIELAQALKYYLSEVGISVEIQSMEHTAFLKKVFQDHDFDLAIYGPSPSSLYYALTYWRTKAALNAPLYSNPEVDRLLDMVVEEKDEEVRHSIYRRIQEIIWSECPAIWLYFENIIIVTRSGVEGLRILPFQMLILDDVYVKN